MSAQKYLKVELLGGLCNKLFCFISAVSIALAEGYVLIEPEFGWKAKVRMSSVWNVDKLRDGIPELKWCSTEVFQLSNVPSDKIFYMSGAELWAYSETVLNKQRSECVLNRNEDIGCRVVAFLEPAECVRACYDINTISEMAKMVAVHFRTESDWQAYSVRKQRRMPVNEHCWTDNVDICYMVVSEFGKDMSVYIVSGEHGDEIGTVLRDMGVKSEYNYKNELEYEQNAAMHWYICCLAGGGFVGLSRSTFSNLICLRRELNHGTVCTGLQAQCNATGVTHNSRPPGVGLEFSVSGTGGCWIYNYWSDGDKKLQRRVDAGLQPEAYNSITKVTNII